MVASRFLAENNTDDTLMWGPNTLLAIIDEYGAPISQ